MKAKLEKLNIKISTEQLEKFEIYTKLLLEWNEKFNLTAIKSHDEIIDKHYIDSLSVKDFVSENGKMIDIGTGAGFPGVPLKIFYPETELVLVDSTQKKVNFLNVLIKELDLKNTTALHARAEELAKNPDYREKFDFVLSRAVANLRVLCELCLPFAKIGGSFISLKGPSVFDELKEAEQTIKTLGAHFSEIKTINLPETDIIHHLLIINKLQITPAAYPRIMSKILKSPLK